jgi:flagellar basal body P-ring formation protein FlgA
MNRCSLPVLAAILLWGVPAAATEFLRIEMPETASVAEATIRLRDLAPTMTGPDSLMRAAGDAVAGPAPLPGRTRHVGVRTLSGALARAGLPMDRVRFSGSDRVAVTREADILSRETVERMAREILERRLADRPEARVVSVSASRPAILPAGEPVAGRIEVRGGGDLLGAVPLTLHFERDGHSVGDVPVSARVAAFGDVVVARRPIPRHAPLEPDVLIVRRMDLAEAPARHFRSVEELRGTRAARRLNAGTALRPDLAERPPLVQRGDRVRILARGAGLEIAALGEVRTPGAAGDRVRVVNIDSGKRLDGRVLDAHTVAVDF